MSTDKIIIRGAREHNLKNINLEIPRGKLVVITGLSGSGKSSLAFDTIYAEGQRRYVESLSAYARQFLGQMDKPDVDYIEGLSPAIAIQQKTHSHNPRSTVGTVTEIYDYLRLLFARTGHPHCHICGKEITRQSAQQIVEQVLKVEPGTKIMVMAPVVSSRKGEYLQVFEFARREGFVRARLDGKMIDLSEQVNLDKKKKHTIEIVVDRLVVKQEIKSRLADSVETALKLGNGTMSINLDSGKSADRIFSEKFACTNCGISLPELSPRMFSFNSPFGACPVCKGLGSKMEVDPDKVIPDRDMSIDEGAVEPWSGHFTGWYSSMLVDMAQKEEFSTSMPFRLLKKSHQQMVLYGTDGFEGVIPNLERRFRETESEYIREDILGNYMKFSLCSACRGARLKPEVLAVTISGRSITGVTELSVKNSLKFFSEMDLTQKETLIARQILKEIKNRLQFLMNVGLDYLTLDRAASTLSGGESERIHLATQIGSSLVGVLYILDEPTIGLHQKDNSCLLDTLVRLRDSGNTVVMVEHDEQAIRSADFLIDLGPGAGASGGKIVAIGPPETVMKSRESLTAAYLRKDRFIPVPSERRKQENKFLEITGVTHNNLKNIDVKIPLETFTCITGVSGSGKSSLIGETLCPALIHEIYHSSDRPPGYREVKGTEHLDKLINIDQSPIGRTPRSNAATYTGVFTLIRDLFAQTPEARVRGFRPGRFSFNVKGGRCETCEGDGIIKIEMHFLPDVYVPCEECRGKRYNDETLQVKYRDKNIADVLDMTVEEALNFFEKIPRIRKILETLYDVGLGYIKLGQSATTLSGGEAQRVKLSRELAKRSTGRTFYVLDEPTTGLHFADIQKLLDVLNRLVDAGNTVAVIEHNLDVIKTADYIIDLGPEGGDAGGEIVVEGTPEEVSMEKKSYTGQFLRMLLKTGVVKRNTVLSGRRS